VDVLIAPLCAALRCSSYAAGVLRRQDRRLGSLLSLVPPLLLEQALICKDLPLTEALSKAGANFYLGPSRGPDHIVHRAGVLLRQEAANLLSHVPLLLLEQALDCMDLPLKEALSKAGNSVISCRMTM